MSSSSGLLLEGETKEEALEMITDAIKLHIEDRIENGEALYEEVLTTRIEVTVWVASNQLLMRKALIRVLEEKGFWLVRQSGSRAIYASSKGIKVTIPIHGKKDLGKGLLKQILKDAGLGFEDLG